MKVTEWTLQGVPTVPPGNVQTEATNSTTIRFTWNPPSPQFINGINQGYKVRGIPLGLPKNEADGVGTLLDQPPQTDSTPP
ncbi:PREDICTED: protein sidekick-2-like [Merops nubicus]|uniref:protein sidekick-2-like n=1 Tax=Merops nubicus TaxID=57421 RepID=UPI0004F052E3|nr:PREDICTED: protein sidekick-2-like [Merops nubicus]